MVKNILTILLSPIFFFAFASQSFAYQIQDLSGTEARGDIVLSPAKIELFMEPGEKATRELMVTNRTGGTVNFGIGIEDFKGSHSPDQIIVFLGLERGSYSLKDWLRPEVQEFTLKSGQRIILPIEISIPADADPGGHYGVIFAVVKPDISAATTGNAGRVSIVSRAGALFFVRIKGNAQENGQLADLNTPKKFYEAGPIKFSVLFENNGSVHLAPYGTIEIKNLLGKVIDKIELDPWFVMPDSLRLREVVWESGFLFGKYTATILVNRGYQDILDQKAISFWVIPWKIVLSGIVVLFFIIWFLFWTFSKFEIKRKT